MTGRRVDEAVCLIDRTDVVDRNALMRVTAQASVNTPTDQDLRSGLLDRIEQFPAADMLDAASVQVESAVAVVERRLM